MPGHSRATLAAGIVAVGLLITAAAVLQGARERRFPTPVVTEQTLYFASPTAVRRLTAGYHALAADVYWIRTIQYYGGIKRELDEGRAGQAGQEPDNYNLLYPLLDLTTSLDPHFNIAYRFGAIFLTEPFPAGAGRPDQAIALLQKGLRAKPDKWEYMMDIGYVHYWWLQDYEAAADWFRRAAEVAGAPWWLRSLAATTLAEGGSRRSSRTMWESIRQSAEIEWLRNDAERRLRQLDALDAIDVLQPIVDRASSAMGAPPRDWAAIVRAGYIRGIPVDPAGTPFEIDAQGRVQLSKQSPLFPLPVEPKRLFPPAS